MREEELNLDEECPFCRTVLKTGATVCPSCGANKRGNNGCGCVVALGIGVSALAAMALVSDGDIGKALGAAGVTLLLVPLFRSVTKPIWYRRNV